MTDRGRFLICGVKQAGLVLAALLLLGVVCLIWGIYSHLARNFSSITMVWAFGIASGPIPPVLISFDISNSLLKVLWVALIIPYWTCLGVGAGFLSWMSIRSGSDVHPTTLTKRASRRMFIAILATSLVIAFVSVPRWTRGFVSGGRSMESGILNNLRQLDGAKQQLALERELSPTYVPTEAELAPYFKRCDYEFRPIGTERYVLNSIAEPPYAVLDSDWRIRRRNWREGYTIPKGKEYRLDRPIAPPEPTTDASKPAP